MNNPGLVELWSGIEVSAYLEDLWTGILFGLALVASLYVSIRLRRILNQ